MSKVISLVFLPHLRFLRLQKLIKIHTTSLLRRLDLVPKRGLVELYVLGVNRCLTRKVMDRGYER
jgi:hypothetical protein